MGRRSKKDRYGFGGDCEIYVRVGKSRYYVSGDKRVWKVKEYRLEEIAKELEGKVSDSGLVYLTGENGERFKTTKRALYERYYLAAIDKIKKDG